MIDMDYGIIVFVFTAAVFALVGIVYTRKRKITAEDFVGSKNSLGTAALATTLFASLMGTWLLFGPAETAVSSGMLALFCYAAGSTISLMSFTKLGIRLRKVMPKGHSLTEFVLHRFGRHMYALVLLFSIFFMIVALTAEMTGIALAANLVFGAPLGFTAMVVGFGVLLYTAIGGFKASVFTDKVQAWVIVPLFALVIVGSLAFMGGLSVFENAAIEAPELFGFNAGGMEFGLALIIAVVGAGFFNQGWWQRVYAGKDESDTKKGFALAGLLAFPVIMIAGILGLFAIGTPAAAEPSIVLFSFLLVNIPEWMIITTMVLATALVMSSMDTFLNGIVSILTVDFVRIKPKSDQKKIMRFAKLVTVVLALFGMTVASYGYSVLYLYLVADIVCVAILFPVVYGFYARRYSGKASVVSAVAGLLAGLLWFPTPDFSASVIGALMGSAAPAFMQGRLLWSFAAALVVPAAVSFMLREKSEYDFSELLRKETNLG